MSGHSAFQVDAQYGVDIQSVKTEVHICGPVASALNTTFNLQVRRFELGLSGDLNLRTLRDCIDGKVPGGLLVKGEIVDVNRRIDDWFLQSAGTGGDEIRTATYRDAALLQLGNTGQGQNSSRSD